MKATNNFKIISFALLFQLVPCGPIQDFYLSQNNHLAPPSKNESYKKNPKPNSTVWSRIPKNIRSQIIALLDDWDHRVREEAILSVISLRPPLQEIKAKLIERLEDPFPQVRGAAIKAVIRLKVPAEEVKPILLQLVECYDGVGIDS